MNTKLITGIVAAFVAVIAHATETINDSLSVQGDVHIGNDTTRIIGDYNGSPWFINEAGRFTFGAHHDHDRSFDIYLPNAEGGQTVEIGQRSKNNSHYNYSTIQFRNADIRIGDNKSLFVDGNVGIGTHNPSAKLHLIVPDGDSNSPSFVIDGPGGAPQLRIGVNETDEYSWIQSHGSRPLRINELGNNTLLNHNDGNVGIGTLSPSHKLAVSGTVRAKEVIVDTGWSDFVFEDSYRLRSLDEVQAHIKEHGHLPDVPSAALVESEGLSVGEAQKIMMQKIEELTLYIIEQDKKISAQELRIKELESN